MEIIAVRRANVLRGRCRRHISNRGSEFQIFCRNFAAPHTVCVAVMNKIIIDSPQAAAHVYDQAITVSGTITGGEPHELVSVWAGDELLGETRVISRDGRFRVLARFDSACNDETTLVLSVRNGAAIVEIPVIVVPADLSRRPYGDVLPPNRSEVLHRENIYGSGPPVENPSGEALALVLQFLAREASVLDVGCGAGAFGPPLIAAGHRWLGIEVDARCAEILERRKLPFKRLANPNQPLPFSNKEFDAAIAIEVLEHVEQFDALIAEVARVTRSRFLVSVPNMEVIPYFAPLGIVPWHLLEATHVNFFTRAGLHAALARHFRHVEVFSYGEHPVRSAHGIPLHVHLFAIADH
jgi:2-polyprenyl-3-methyl-5-hydroxy-6-metoxy-1,4-benzoquinol methylase